MGKSVMEVIAETKEKHLRSFIRDGGTPSQFEEFWKTQEGEVSRHALRLVEEEESSQASSGSNGSGNAGRTGAPMDRNPYKEMTPQEKGDFIREYGSDAYAELCCKYVPTLQDL